MLFWVNSARDTCRGAEHGIEAFRPVLSPGRFKVEDM